MTSLQLGISVYGQSFSHLKHCLESCLVQQDGELQLQISIRVDGPGNDSAAEDVRAYLRSVAERENIVRLEEGNERLGTFGSYRKIFSGSQADYLAQVDADDALAPAAIRRSLDLLAIYDDASFLYTDCIEMDADGCPIRLSRRQSLPYSEVNILVQFMTFHLRVVRRLAYEFVGGYDAGLKYVGDYDLSLKLSEVGDVIYLQRPMYFYRVHEASESQKFRGEADREAFRVCRAALKRRALDSTYCLVQHHDGSMQLNLID